MSYLGRALLAPRPRGGAVANPWYDPNGEGLCIWEAWLAKGAASYAASLLGLTGAHNLVEGNGAVPWAMGTGWSFAAAASQYFDTLFTPQNDQSQSALVQFANIANTGEILSMLHAANRSFRIRPDDGSARVVYSNGNLQSVGPSAAAGNLAVAGAQGYRNGAADGGALGAWGGASTLSIYIGARNTGAALSQFISCDVIAVAIYDCALTGAQVSAVATAMAAL